MAVNDARSMNADLKQGVRDGKYKSLTPDRGGSVEMQAVMERVDDLQTQYGMSVEDHPVGCMCGYCYY